MCFFILAIWPSKPANLKHFREKPLVVPVTRETAAKREAGNEKSRMEEMKSLSCLWAAAEISH